MRSYSRRALSVLLLVVVAGCSSTSPTAGIERYQEVRPKVLYRGAQPTDAGFEQLKQAGIRTVIDLRRGERGEEEAIVRRLGMQYVNIPCSADEPNDENMARVLRIVMDPAKQPVFVHCRQGRDRTGTVAAIYRMAFDNWTYEQAASELRKYQGMNSLYFPQIPAYLSKLNMTQFMQKVRGAAVTVGGGQPTATN